MMALTEGHRLIDLTADLRKQGKLREAIAVFGKLIELFGKSEFYNERGVLHSECQEFGNAIIDFTDAIGINDADADLYINRGNAYLWSGAFDSAVGDYSTAINLSPNDAYPFNGRAQAFAEIGEIERAISDFQHAIRIDDNYVSPLFNLGVLLFENNRLDSAYESLNRAAELRPHDADILCVRGDLLRRIGKHQAALGDYSNAVAHNSQCVPALCRLSWMLSASADESIRDAAQSLVHAKTCCELTSYDDEECLEVLARAFAEVGDYDSAARWETRAIQSTAGEEELSLARNRLRLYQSRRRPDEDE